jgi:dihydrofolate reductase
MLRNISKINYGDIQITNEKFQIISRLLLILVSCRQTESTQNQLQRLLHLLTYGARKKDQKVIRSWQTSGSNLWKMALRKTDEIWEPYWPHHADAWPGVNVATKYVASNTWTSSKWQPSVFLSGDIADKVAKIKQQSGPDLHVWGSGHLLQTLIKQDLVDAFWLMIYPITLGGGKRFFADGTIPAAFKVTESHVSPTGVIIVNYERSGAVTTGTL